ncbi:hypothetical protein ACP4OV_031182 [Aristida adscensionis]
MGRGGSSSSASPLRRVNRAKQVEDVFEELTSKIEPADFDIPHELKEWRVAYYSPIKRNCGMLFSCCSSNCGCDSTCANKSFQHRPLKNMRLIM